MLQALNRRFLMGWVTCLAAGSVHVNAASTAVYSLGPGVLSGSVVQFDVGLEFTSDSGEELVFFGLDVASSDSVLTAGGTDFSRFDFVPALPLLEDWAVVGALLFGSGQSSVSFHTVAPDLNPLAPGNYSLGVLLLDTTGIGAGTGFSVSLQAFDSVLGVELPGDPASFAFVDPDSDPGGRIFTLPAPSGGGVPEPDEFLLVVVGFSGLVALLNFKRRELRPEV